MKRAEPVTLLVASRLVTPLALLFGAAMLAARPPGDGVGLLAGLVVALVIVLHALVFGAGAARAAVSPLFARLMLAVGLGGTLIQAGVPGWSFSAQVGEAGAFIATVGVSSLITVALFGRAPGMRDEDL